MAESRRQRALKRKQELSRRQRAFKNRIPLYRRDPVLFAKEICGFECDNWQKQVLRDLAKNPRVAIKSGQGVGKTGVEAVAVLWFLTCFPFPRVVCTAPTKQQLHDVLWAEISKWMSNSDLLSELLKWTKTYVYMSGYEKRWFAVARTATKPENMQGFHETNMLFIVDEASGVADPIMEAIKGTLSGNNNKLLLCGNPTRTSGTFFDAFNADRELYKCYTVDSRDSIRTNKEMLRSMITKYGDDSNFVRVRIKGLFPKGEDDVFMRYDDLEANLNAEPASFERDEAGKLVAIKPITTIHIGCDVARFGQDKTCIGYRLNERCEFYKQTRGQDTVRTAHDIATLALNLKNKYNFKRRMPVKIDDGGVGGGVTDKLREIIRDEPELYSFIDVIPVIFGKKIKHDYYDDTTTYMMAVLRDLIATVDDDGNPKAPDLILPNDNALFAQLSTRKYEYTTTNKQRVESKDTYKKRHNEQSPDEGDCILLVALPVNEKG